MAFRLEVQSEGSGEGSWSVAVSGHRATIGRGAECDVRLDGIGVSHHHATVYHCGRSFLVADEGSANGTGVGEALLAPRSARLVLPGESVRVGRVRIDLCNEERAAPPKDAKTVDLALAMVKEMTSGTQGERATPWIAVMSGREAGRALLLTAEDRPYFIGRGSSADLSLENERVSRRQLSVVRRGREVSIVAIAQNHRASLGAMPLLAAEAIRWVPGTPVTIADTTIGLFDPAHELEQKLLSTANHPHAIASEPEPQSNANRSLVASTGAEKRPSALAPPAHIEPKRRRWPWSTLDTTVMILTSLAIAGAAAILVWLFVPWSR